MLENRKLEFSCLVNFLQTKNITDEYFTYASKLENASDCDEIINQYQLNIAETFTEEYYTTHNASVLICKEIQKPLCHSSSVIINDSDSHENSTNNQSTKHCFDINSLKINQVENIEKLYEARKENCKEILICLNCINENLENTNFESITLHAKLINITSSVIEFRFWEYFTVTSRVRELLSDANTLKNEVDSECKCTMK